MLNDDTTDPELAAVAAVAVASIGTDDDYDEFVTTVPHRRRHRS